MAIAKVTLPQTVKDSALTTGATVVNGLLGIVFFILAARELGPEAYGVMALAVATLTLIADVSNLGTDTGLIRFIGQYRQQDSQRALRFLKLAVETKLVVWLVILAVGWWLAPMVANNLFGKASFTVPLRYCLVGVGGSLLFSFVTNGLQAYQKFREWAVLNISMNALRLLMLGLLIMTASLSLVSGLGLYVAVPFVGFVVGVILLPNFWKVKEGLVVAKEFFHYNKWVALFALVAAVSARMDTFLTARLLPERDLGIYSAANQLAAIIPQLVYAIATVVAPRLAGFDTHLKAVVYLKKLQLMVLGLALVGLLAIPAAAILIPILYGSAYSPSIGLFNILFVAQLIFLISLPAHQAVFYYFSKPALFVVIALIHLGIVVGLGPALIGRFGAMGAAMAVLIGNLSNFMIPAVWVVYQFRKKTTT